MDSSSTSSEFETLLEKFIDRHREGDRPSVNDFAAQHPQFAAQLRDLLPALLLIEGLAPGSESSATASLERTALENSVELKRIGDYRILREIGRGGMGIVFEAEQVSLNRRVALKVLPRGTLDDRFVERFQREAQAAANLNHTNIVQIYDVGEEDGRLFYAMQYIRGAGLDEIITELHRLRLEAAGQSPGGNPVNNSRHRELDRTTVDSDSAIQNNIDCVTSLMSMGEKPIDSATQPTSVSPGSGPGYYHRVARIGVQVAEALAFAHRHGVLHRDIKPANILLDLTGNAWITDFGLARREGDRALTETGDIVGTLRYMPPESFHNQTDQRSEVYALAITLYEILVLRPAFDAANRFRLIQLIAQTGPLSLRAIDPEIAPDLETILEKAFEKEPARRYQSATEFSADLQRYLNDEPVHARRVSLFERTERWARRNVALSSLIAMVALLLVLLSVGSTIAALYFSDQEARQRMLTEDVTRLAQQRERDYQAAVEARNAASLARDDADSARAVAEQRAQDLRRTLYFSEMNAASEALETPFGFVSLLRQLDRWLPTAGEVDLRGWEWYFLRSFYDRHDREFLFGLSRRRLQMHPDSEHVIYGTDGHSGWANLLTGESSMQRLDAISLSPDGSTVVTTLAGTIVVRDFPLLTERLRIERPGEEILALSFSPDGQRFAATFASRCLIFTTSSADPLATIVGDFSTHRASVWHPDASRNLLALSSRTRFAVLDVAAATVVKSQDLRKAISEGSPLAWHPDQPWLAISCDLGSYDRWYGSDTKVMSFGAEAGTQIQELPGSRARWTFDGQRLATVDKNQIHLWHGTSFDEVGSLTGHGGAVTCLAWNMSGDQLLSGSHDRTVRIWDTVAMQVKRVFRGHDHFVGTVDWTPDGTRVISLDFAHRARVWRTDDPGAVVRLIGASLSDRPSAVAWNSEGTEVAVSADEGPLRIWDADTGELLRTLDDVRLSTDVLWQPKSENVITVTHSGLVMKSSPDAQAAAQRQTTVGCLGVAVSPDGSRIAVAENQPQVELFDIHTLETLRTIRIGSDRALAVSWHPDGRRLAIGCYNGVCEVRDVNSGDLLRQFDGHRAQVHDVAWSPDGSLLASGGQDATVRIQDAESGDIVATLDGHGHIVQCLSWSPDGRRLATGGEDRTIRIWDTASWQCATRLNQTGAVRDLAWDAEGTRLAVCCRDGSVQILDAIKAHGL